MCSALAAIVRHCFAGVMINNNMDLLRDDVMPRLIEMRFTQAPGFCWKSEYSFKPLGVEAPFSRWILIGWFKTDVEAESHAKWFGKHVLMQSLVRVRLKFGSAVIEFGGSASSKDR